MWWALWKMQLSLQWSEGMCHGTQEEAFHLYSWSHFYSIYPFYGWEHLGSYPEIMYTRSHKKWQNMTKAHKKWRISSPTPPTESEFAFNRISSCYICIFRFARLWLNFFSPLNDYSHKSNEKVMLAVCWCLSLAPSPS